MSKSIFSHAKQIEMKRQKCMCTCVRAHRSFKWKTEKKKPSKCVDLPILVATWQTNRQRPMRRKKKGKIKHGNNEYELMLMRNNMKAITRQQHGMRPLIFCYWILSDLARIHFNKLLQLNCCIHEALDLVHVLGRSLALVGWLFSFRFSHNEHNSMYYQKQSNDNFWLSIRYLERIYGPKPKYMNTHARLLLYLC